jgi:hypothetical protein
VYIAYCTNIHPAESWSETFDALKNHALKAANNLAKVYWTELT